ncbi:hypothetical protein D7V86_24665 [bacterium D16-51]|nr:hypothetical protein D7V96_25295 [bacterium D16-59]RKI53784.1 hypothetical protein D7V86_24665 [bacterium D16-51]
MSSTSSFCGVTGCVLAGTGDFGGAACSCFVVLVCVGVGVFTAGFSSEAGAVADGAGLGCCVSAVWRAGCAAFGVVWTLRYAAGGVVLCSEASACCFDGADAVLTGVLLNGVLKRSHPSVSKEYLIFRIPPLHGMLSVCGIP